MVVIGIKISLILWSIGVVLDIVLTYNAAMAETKVIYGCNRTDISIHCDPVPNTFNSFLIPGQADEIYEVTPSLFTGVHGQYGNGLPLKGYVGEFFTVPNSVSLSPNVFSVAFWAKQDSDFGLDGTVISHTDRTNTGGWHIDIKVKPSPRIEFSVMNTQGEIFTADSAIFQDKFEFVAGTFDGSSVRLYLNGVLKNETQFSGKYKADPEGPLNIGLDSYYHTNSWKGTIDEVHFFNRVISDSEISEIMNRKGQGLTGLVGYWPFDDSTVDLSRSGNDGKISTQAVSMAFSPDGRLFFTEKNVGEVRILKDDKLIPEPFVKVNDFYVAQHQGLLGITLDPDFDSNHYVYIYYTSNGSETGARFNKVVRFIESNNKAVDEKVLLDNIPASAEGEFAGGALAFGPDDKLYISTGHANSAELPQNKTSLIGKVLRINKDGTIPPDNPFPNSPIYTIGHRNIFGIAFDEKTGLGIVTENGDAHYDEINILEKGGNYGFPTTQPATISPQLDNSSSVKPLRAYWETIAPTQAIFYNGNKFPELKNKLLFGSYNQGYIYAIGLNGTGSVSDELSVEFPYDDNVDSIAQSPLGDIYFGGYKIYKVSSINKEQSKELTQFIELSPLDVKASNLRFDFNNASMHFDVKTADVESGSTPSIQVRIPKTLMSGIYEVSAAASKTGENENIVNRFDIKQQYRASNIGDTIVDISMKTGLKGTVVIKGTRSDNLE